MKTLNQILRANFRLIALFFGVIPVVVLAPASAQAGITTVASTIPSNGDLNPYGVARVPTTTGSKHHHSEHGQAARWHDVR